jgi:hypothetical protein
MEQKPIEAPEPVMKKDPPTSEQKEQVAKLPRGNRNREEMLAHIRETRGEPKEEVKQEKPEPKQETKEVKDEPKPEPEAKKEEPKQDAQAPQPEANTEAPPAANETNQTVQTVQTVRVKVDGEEYDAPKEEVDAYGGLRAYQIAKAQENRLAKVNEALAALREQQARPQAQQVPVQTDSDFIKSQIDVMRFGTPEESAAALDKILERRQQKVDPNLIVLQATLAIQKKAAVDQFAKDYPEIIASPVLKKLALALEAEEMQKIGQSRAPVDFKKVYDGIGQQIRGAIPRQHQAQSSAPTNSGNTSQVSSDKEARKASITEPPKASAARATLPEEEKPETREESLNRMRRTRGQMAH